MEKKHKIMLDLGKLQKVTKTTIINKKKCYMPTFFLIIINSLKLVKGNIGIDF